MNRTRAVVPERIEPIEQLAARYPAALVDIWDHKAEDWPLTAEHVFDTPGGIRLIISRERDVMGALWVHASASILSLPPGLELADRLRQSGRDPTPIFCARAVAAWIEIAGGKLPSEPQFIGIAPGKGIPHWFSRIVS